MRDVWGDVEGRFDPHDFRKRFNLRQDACYLFADSGAGYPLRRAEDDRRLAAGLTREVFLKNVERCLGLGAGNVERVDEVPAYRTRANEETDEKDDPSAKYEPTAAIREGCPSL